MIPQRLSNGSWLRSGLRGGEIPTDGNALHVAVVAMLPTDDVLKAYVEGEELGSVDRRRALSDERSRIIASLLPSEPEDTEPVP